MIYLRTEYVAPEIQLAGEVDTVVLGSGLHGGDLSGEYQMPGGDFLSDDLDGNQD